MRIQPPQLDAARGLQRCGLSYSSSRKSCDTQLRSPAVRSALNGVSNAPPQLLAAAAAYPFLVAGLLVFLQRKQTSSETDTDRPRDVDADFAFRPISYSPFPVEADEGSHQLRVEVGPVASLKRTTFVFDRLLSGKSEIFTISLPRPMGIVFEEESGTGRVVVADLIEGTPAHQRSQISKLDNRSQQSAQKGDLLRACTCTNFLYQSSALFGAKAPSRTIVLYGADNQRWPQVIGALRKGDKADGPVTLVLERG